MVEGFKEAETPPRAWGRPVLLAGNDGYHGNTPTGVGKTQISRHLALWLRKHPHGRGEDYPRDVNAPLEMETPPRAWGRRKRPNLIGPGIGNTPTGVGKTQQRASAWPWRWKHPHGRGEDKISTWPIRSCPETPPRAWGRQHTTHATQRAVGNTPTGVGKTLASFSRRLSS